MGQGIMEDVLLHDAGSSGRAAYSSASDLPEIQQVLPCYKAEKRCGFYTIRSVPAGGILSGRQKPASVPDMKDRLWI